jgi:hypothetical protein
LFPDDLLLASIKSVVSCFPILLWQLLPNLNDSMAILSSERNIIELHFPEKQVLLSVVMGFALCK